MSEAMGRCSREAAAWALRFRAMTGRIDKFYLPLEPIFLAAGERLRELHGKMLRLSQSVESAGATLSSDAFSDLVQGLGQATTHIDQLRQHRDGLGPALAGMVSTTTTMLSSLNALGRIMYHVQVLAINGKIEASQLVNTDTDFTVFTREIANLAKSGLKTVNDVCQELMGLQAAAGQARELQEAFEKKELPELDTISERLVSSTQQLSSRRSRAIHGAREISSRLQGLFGHLTSLVSDMQIYDIIRQRLEHVEQALSLAAGMIEAKNASDMDELQQRVFINGIADLQSQQLTQAGTHYAKSVSDVGRALNALVRDVAGLEALCEQTFGGEGGHRSLLDIDQDLTKASALLSGFAATRSQAEQSLTHVVEAAERAGKLMRSLNSVNSEMRLMGLNASIKCGNIGSQGRALNVIAQELQSYANLTRVQVESVADNLGQISGSARDISLSGNESGGASIEEFKRTLDQVIERLNQTGTELAGLLDGIVSLGASMVAAARSADVEFSGKVDCRAAMDDGVRELKSVANESDPGLSGQALEEARRNVLAFTESHYTMASERSVHGAVVSKEELLHVLTGADANGAAGQSGSDQEPDISSLLF